MLEQMKQQSTQQQDIVVQNEMRQQDYDSLKAEYDEKMSEVMSINKQTILDKEKKWTDEKMQLQQQLEFTTAQIEENRKMHKQLMQALSQKQSEEQDSGQLSEMKQHNREIQEINKMLSQTVSKQESKNTELNDKVTKLKVYRKCFERSLSSQCKFCHSFYPTEVFFDHIKTCSKEMGNFSRDHFFKMQLDTQIVNAEIEVDPIENKSFTVYHIQVYFNNEQQWTVKQ